MYEYSRIDKYNGWSILANTNICISLRVIDFNGFLNISIGIGLIKRYRYWLLISITCIRFQNQTYLWL